MKVDGLAKLFRTTFVDCGDDGFMKTEVGNRIVGIWYRSARSSLILDIPEHLEDLGEELVAQTLPEDLVECSIERGGIAAQLRFALPLPQHVLYLLSLLISKPLDHAL